MRKIEQQMVNAIQAGKSWQSGNTQVVTVRGASGVYLFGQHIATVEDGDVRVNPVSLAQYPTVTTKSRLRALGVNVSTRQGVTYLDGKAI